MSLIKAFSYSKYSTWNLCPGQFKHQYLDKLPIGDSPAMDRGNAIHKEVEEYLRLPSMPMPQSCESVSAHLEAAKGYQAHSEEFWACNKEFKPTRGWDNDTWLNGKVDYYFKIDTTLFIGDIKTGKVRPKNVDQLELYACMGFGRYPEIGQIVTKLLYVDSGVVQEHIFTRSNFEVLKARWHARVEPMMAATEFPYKENTFCGWCPYRKSIGGPCTLGEDYK